MYYGVYRATVVNATDPTQALMVQVRVHGVHHEAFPDTALPWAHPLVAGGRGMSGLFVPYRIGDNVLVQFEGGDVRFPIIMGGIPAASPDSVSDVPFEMQEDREGGRRILLIDERGNCLELSAKPGDSSVRIRSGGSSVKVSSAGESVTVEAIGNVVVKGATVTVQAGVANTTAGVVNIRAETGAAEEGVATLQSDKRVDVMSDDEVNIGGRVENFLGAAAAPSQTPKTNIRSQVINVGSSVGATDSMPSSTGVPAPPIPLLPTLTVNINGSNAVNINTAAASVTANTVDITAATTVDITATASVNISAAQINLGT